MSEQRMLLADTTRRLLEDLSKTPDLAFDAAWEQVEALGLPALMQSEAAGGFGGGWSDLMAVQWEAGRLASPLPLGDAILAGWAVAEAGLEPLPGFGAITLDLRGARRGETFSGEFRNVPFGRNATWVVGVCDDGALVRLDPAKGAVTQGANLAGEARDAIRFDDAPCEVGGRLADGAILDCGALMRVGQMSGALRGALALTADYVKTRVQFGKPLGGFQAVQQALAIFAADASAADCAARAACEAADRTSPGQAWYAIAAAKLRANLASGVATSTAHQLHGAIGFTHEYGLHPLTRRLWSWRTEAGNDRFWSARLGAHVARRGAENAWNDISAA